MDIKFDGLYSQIAYSKIIYEWEVYVGDKQAIGTFSEVCDEMGDYDWHITIDNQNQFTDEEIDELTDYIRMNIKK